MQLERVIGLTTSHNSALATNPATGDVAIPAGCILIIYQPRKNRQVRNNSNGIRVLIFLLRFLSSYRNTFLGPKCQYIVLHSVQMGNMLRWEE